MEKNKTEKNGNNDGKHRIFSFAICAAIAVAAAAALILCGETGFERYGNASTPAPESAAKTAAPTLEGGTGNNRRDEAEGGALSTPQPQDGALQHVKTTIFADGNPVVTLASGRAAEELAEAVRMHFDGFVNRSGAVTSFLNEISFAAADENAEIVSYDEAFAFLTGSSSPLRVQSRLVEHEFVTLPFETTTFESENFYYGTRFVAEYGRSGKKINVHEYIYINGALQSERTLESELLSAPLGERIIIGTRPRPTAGGVTAAGEYPVSSVVFARPVDAAVTSFFGMINGSMHEGIDFAAAEGSSCTAAASGVVIAVLERGSMGVTVDIRHENGFVTRYAGLAAANTALGARVGAGDRIGTVGANGLHFGIYANGVPCDPRAYISSPAQ